MPPPFEKPQEGAPPSPFVKTESNLVMEVDWVFMSEGGSLAGDDAPAKHLKYQARFVRIKLFILDFNKSQR